MLIAHLVNSRARVFILKKLVSNMQGTHRGNAGLIGTVGGTSAKGTGKARFVGKR